MPWGLQTHTYAPANVDMRNKWQICGSQPGEPAETQELGIGAPPEGLYLREDIEIKCNMTMISFVKKEMKAASKILVDRMLKKAELLDSGALSALMENGKLKTFNPADRSSGTKQAASTLLPNQQPYKVPVSPMAAAAVPAPQKNHPPQDQGIVMELPGDFYYPQPSPNQQTSQEKRFSTVSELSDNDRNTGTVDSRWSYQSASTRPSSYSSSAGGMRSPGLEYNKEFSVELPTMDEETYSEHEARRKVQERTFEEVKLQDLNGPGKEQPYRYNPQDYAQYTQPPQYSAHDGRRPNGA